MKNEFKSHLVDKINHEKITDELLNEIIVRNFAEYKKLGENEKGFNVSDFILGIQKDICSIDDNYQ